jgi:hypothetical protein
MTPFYKKALALFTRTQKAQIQKGLAKYPEPFNPFSWTPEELLNHALEETVDLTHYLVGLKELLDAKDKELQKYKDRCADYERKLNKVLVPDLRNLENYNNKGRESPFKQQYDLNFNPHFDQDDQY